MPCDIVLSFKNVFAYKKSTSNAAGRSLKGQKESTIVCLFDSVRHINNLSVM